MNHIISFCIVEYALELKKIEKYIRQSILDEELPPILREKDKIPYDYKNNILHSLILISRKRKGITGGTINMFLSEHEKAQQHVFKYESRFGKDAFLQINKDICFKVRDGHFDYNLFALICAVKSAIGKVSKFKRITKAQIRHRINGFKTQKIMDEIIQRKTNSTKGKKVFDNLTKKFIELNDKQIERLRDKVEQLNFFRKYTYHRRQTFYSTRLNINQLIEAVHESKNYVLQKEVDNLEAKLEIEIKQRKLQEKIDFLKSEIQVIQG